MKIKILLLMLSLTLTGCSSAQEEEHGEIIKREVQEALLAEIESLESESIEELETEEIEESIQEPEPIPELEPEETIDSDVVSINCKEVELEAFNLINKEREATGLEPLTWSDELYEAARIRAEESSHYWSHTRPDGSHWSTVSDLCTGENLAKGFTDPEELVAGWMSSPGHKENILRDFEQGAIYFYEAENGWFWCNSFGY